MNCKVKHNLTGKACEKIRLVTLLKTNIFFHSENFQEKSTFVYTDFLHPTDNVLLCKAMLVCY